MNDIKLKREDFINQYPPLNLLNKQDVERIWEKEDFHLYVHIPYCIKKCDFCYYISYECKIHQIPEDYLDALKKEIRMYGDMEQIKGRKLRSIYIGGGTPTLMTLTQIKELLDVIWESFDVHDDVEFCCEVRPGPETKKDKIMLMKEYGLKRISIGCQSLNDNVLKLNGRNHNSKAFYKTYDMVRECDVFSINVDLMSGLLGDTLESFLFSVDEMIRLRPENLTIYKMEVYLNNQLYKRALDQEIKFMSDQEEAEMVTLAYSYQREVALYLLELVKELKYGSEFNENGKNIIWGPEELESNYNKILLTPSDPDSAALLQRFCGVMWAYTESIFFRAHDVTKEIHGPYHLPEKLSGLLIREYMNLNPYEIWEDTPLLTYNNIQVYTNYDDQLELTIDSYNHLFLHKGNYKENLLSYAILCDQRQIDIHELPDIINNMLKTIEHIHKWADQAGWKNITKRYADIFWYRKKAFKDLLGLDWRVPVSIYDKIDNGEKDIRREDILNAKQIDCLIQILI